jgi:hypothetical protein
VGCGIMQRVFRGEEGQLDGHVLTHAYVENTLTPPLDRVEEFLSYLTYAANKFELSFIIDYLRILDGPVRLCIN